MSSGTSFQPLASLDSEARPPLCVSVTQMKNEVDIQCQVERDSVFGLKMEVLRTGEASQCLCVHEELGLDAGQVCLVLTP